MIKTNYIHEGDTIDFMSTLGDECAHLVIADPPYNLGKDFGLETKYEDREKWLEWSKKWIREAVRVLHHKGNIFIYAIHHNACFLHCFLYELGLLYRRQIIWFYENSWSKYRNGPACHYEPILWFAKSAESTFHPIREPYKSTQRLKHKITKNGKVWVPHPEGRLGGDVWRFPTLAGKRFAGERVDHPTQKPLSVTRRIVNHFSNPGDLVLVPFVGSGTECVAAVELGRKYIGAELNPDYVKIAEMRIAQILLSETEMAL